MTKRIAFVVNTLSNGGAERTISNITNNLPDEYKVDIIINEDNAISYPVKGDVLSLGLNPQTDKLKFSYQVKLILKRIVALRKLKKQNHYLAVISFSESASIANILSGKRYCKTIISVRINLSGCINSKLYKFLGFPAVKLLYNHADRIIAVSEGVRLDLIENFGIKTDKVVTIPNGCDIDIIKEKAKMDTDGSVNKIFSGCKVIATMGRLDYQKGQWHLIKAIRKVVDDGFDIRLIIIGQGKYREFLEEVVADNSLKDYVFFLGFQQNPFSIIAKSDIYVLPSIYEGMGNSLIEALACGLPCISTDHASGAREILAPETNVKNKAIDIEYAEYGILTPVCDGKYDKEKPLSNEEILLASAIEKMLDDEELRNKYVCNASTRATAMNIVATSQLWVREFEYQN